LFATLSERLENAIVLSDEFFLEIMEHPIPADLEIVKLLSSVFGRSALPKSRKMARP
jgi:hypothetical protein